MRRRGAFLIGAVVVVLVALVANLAVGAGETGLRHVLATAVAYDPDDFDHHIIVYQRLPRALIALYVGMLMACGGLVLQGLTRNPLASPSTLGINAGAALFVVAGAFVFDLGMAGLGVAALAGGIGGFLSAVAVARLAGHSTDPRGLTLILSGALVSMLFIGIANAFLLSDPARRSDFLAWITGNINHVYIDRLYDTWWLGGLSLLTLGVLARPLTLITLGAEKAASAGVSVVWVTRLALAAVIVGASSAVAICGPVAFVGLVVPHIVRPFVGAGFGLGLPAAALTGGAVCLIADLAARHAFAPYVLHTGVILDLLGGLVFAVIAKRFYLTPDSGRPS